VKDRPVTVRLDSIPEKSYKGVIRSVATLAQPLERNSPLRYFACEVGIAGVGQDLTQIRPGMSLKASVVVEEHDSCFVVPASAVTFKGSENLVYVQQGEEFVPRPVEIAMGPHGQIIILDGVSEGDSLALRNPFETRRLSLPDFSKGTAGLDSPGDRPGPGRFRRR
jgi:multidrug efflux pump subunit AcrA (membrane-fusion protein)